MTDCSSIHGSTSSSDLNSRYSRDYDPSSRIRVVKLVRPHPTKNRSTLIGQPISSFGFSLRGGREFGTGFFVSHVVPGSEADKKDLRIGDQIIRIGGDLKGQGSVLYNVDDAVHKELTHFISNQDRLILKVRSVGIIPVKEKPTDQLIWHVVPLRERDRIDDIIVRDLRIVLNVAPKTKLGLGICKGPDWRPGIFVQFTKENSIARESGLRVGDQILKINGIELNEHISFNQAVAIMKSAKVLELIVRTGIGLDLFPDSSGYNSSTSSITGDQSPSWGDQAFKRLSIVREESNSFNSCDRLGTFRPLNRDRLDLDRRKEKLLPVETPRVPSTFVDSNSTINTNSKAKNNTTVIKLSETGTLINNTLIPNTLKSNEDQTARENNAQNSVTRNSPTENGINDRKLANICFVSKQNETKVVTVEIHRSASIASNIPPPPAFLNSNSNSNNNSESEIKSEDKETTEDSQSAASEQTTSLSNAISEELKRRAEKKLKSQQPTPTASQMTRKLLPSQSTDKQFTARHDALMDEFKKAHRKMFKKGFVENENEAKSETADEKSPEESEKDVEISSVQQKITDVLQKTPEPDYMPTTPLPDYDSGTLPKTNNSPKGTMGRVAISEMAKACGNAAELESLESFKLEATIPNPPPIYFSGPKSGPPTMKKIQAKPISVIVDEYSNSVKKETGKPDEINGNQEEKPTRLKYEPEKCLWRTNLNKQNDSMDDTLNHQNNKFNEKLNKWNSSSNSYNVEKNNNKILTKNDLRKTDFPLNGILKNVNNSGKNHTTKNISFGDVKK